MDKCSNVLHLRVPTSLGHIKRSSIHRYTETTYLYENQFIKPIPQTTPVTAKVVKS